MNYDEIMRRAEARKEEFEAFRIEIANIESPTDCKAGVDAVGERFIRLSSLAEAAKRPAVLTVGL